MSVWDNVQACFEFGHGFAGEDFDKGDVNHDARGDGEAGGQEEVFGPGRVRDEEGEGGPNGGTQAGGSDNAEGEADVTVRTGGRAFRHGGWGE